MGVGVSWQCLEDPLTSTCPFSDDYTTEALSIVISRQCRCEDNTLIYTNIINEQRLKGDFYLEEGLVFMPNLSAPNHRVVRAKTTKGTRNEGPLN